LFYTSDFFDRKAIGWRHAPAARRHCSGELFQQKGLSGMARINEQAIFACGRKTTNKTPFESGRHEVEKCRGLDRCMASLLCAALGENALLNRNQFRSAYLR